MKANQMAVQVQRWHGGQYPTKSTVTRLMQQDGLRPYEWISKPNQRYAVRSHGYDKILYLIDGSLEIHLPDTNERVRLRGGDRIDIPAGVRHGTISGMGGAVCLEAAVMRRPARR